MARPRHKNSTISYGNYGLEPNEDKKLLLLLEDKDMTAKQLVRYLLRNFIKDNYSPIKHGIIK